MEARLQSIDSNRVKYTESQDSIRLSAAAVQPAQQMICKRVTVVVAQPFAKATCQNAGELPTDLFAYLAIILRPVAGVLRLSARAFSPAG